LGVYLQDKLSRERSLTVRNPFRSEPEAFRFVFLSIAYFAAIALASILGGKWAGIAVFAVLSVAFVAQLVRPDGGQPPLPTTIPPRKSADWQILVVANETVAGTALLEAVRHATIRPGAKVLLVSPALNSHLRHWTSDTDPARAEAERRLGESLERLRTAGIDAEGTVGDSDPLQAIEDVLRVRGADELIISTHPEGRSNWLERRVVEQATERFGLPTTHVVVDLERERSLAPASS
jgi:hypothetical protein